MTHHAQKNQKDQADKWNIKHGHVYYKPKSSTISPALIHHFLPHNIQVNLNFIGALVLSALNFECILVLLLYKGSCFLFMRT